MKTREIAGVKVFVSNEAYDEYKGTLQEQINELQSNWNSLREWLEEQNNFYKISTMGYSYGVICNVLDKMNELEGVDNN